VRDKVEVPSKLLQSPPLRNRRNSSPRTLFVRKVEERRMLAAAMSVATQVPDVKLVRATREKRNRLAAHGEATLEQRKSVAAIGAAATEEDKGSARATRVAIEESRKPVRATAVAVTEEDRKPARATEAVGTQAEENKLAPAVVKGEDKKLAGDRRVEEATKAAEVKREEETREAIREATSRASKLRS
jgi:hypothetical protein